MSDTIKSDYDLDQYAAAAARDIADEVKQYGGEPYDLAHEHANDCEYVIYYHHAHAICQNCRVENGEAFLEDIGGPGKDATYNSIATVIAYGELRARIEQKLYDMGVES
jgi:hypothetical protein